MKNRFRLVAPLFALLAMAGCDTPEEPPVIETPDPDQISKCTVVLEASLDVTTRAVLTDAVSLEWGSQDKSAFVAMDSEGKTYSPASVTIEQGKALCSVEIPEEVTSLRLFYNAKEISATTLKVQVAAESLLSAAGSTEGISLVLMGMEPVAVGPEVESASAPLAPAASLVRYVVYSSDEAYQGEKILSVSLEASAPVNGTLTYTLADNKATLAAGTTTSKVSLTTPYEVGADKESAKGIFMPLAPAVSEGVKYVVVTNVAKYSFELADEVSFRAASIHGAYFDLKNATSRLENDAQVVSYDVSYLVGSLQMSAMGGVQDMGYYLASVNGVQDVTNYEADYYTQISFECRDAEGEKVDWVACEIQNYNHPVLTVAKNESTEGRFCTVDIIYTPSSKLYAIENPVIATIQVAQNGATATHSLSYKWFGDSEILVAGAGQSGVKGLGYFLAYLDGSSTAVSDAEALEPFFKTVEVASDADWCRVTIVGGNFNNIQLEPVEANPSTTQERRATITATFKGDTELYTMSPDNTAFVLTVIQQPSKPEGQKSELYYTTDNLSLAPMISASGVSGVDLGYFFAMVDGMQTDDGDSKYFASLELTSSASWLTASISGNHIYITAEPSAEGWRKGVLTLTYPESDAEVEILGGNPVVTVEVTQMPATTDSNTAVYTFGNDPNNIVLRKDMTVGKGGCQNMGVTWMSVYKIINGVVDSTRDNNFSDEAHAMTYSYVDADGESIDWLSAGVGSDWLNYSAAENNTGARRVGYILVHPATAPGQAYEGYDILDPCLVVRVVQSAE